MSSYKKKMVWTTNKVALEVCYRLLCTDLGVGILCILSLNHNTHRKKWCLSAMGKMSFEVKKCVGNAFSRDLETEMLKFPTLLPIMGVPQEILTYQTVKKLNLWEKTAVGKSARIKACYVATIYCILLLYMAVENNKNPKKKTKLDKNWCSAKSRYLENGL